jgi:hypothetical protein
VLRLSLRDLIILLKACSGGSYVLGPVEVGSGGETSYGVNARAFGHVRPGKSRHVRSLYHLRTPPHDPANIIHCLVRAAEALDAAARARAGEGSDALWDMSLRQLLTHALAVYSRPGNR